MSLSTGSYGFINGDSGAEYHINEPFSYMYSDEF